MIDIALALNAINPSAAYRLNQSNPPHKIIEWRGPGTQPTESEISAAYQQSKREILLTTLDDAMHQYLIDRGYTRNEREGLQSSYTNILRDELQGPLTTNQEAAKNHIESAWAFVDEVILSYYYAKKLEIEAAEDVDTVTWDFSALNDRDPGVRLQEIKFLMT